MKSLTKNKTVVNEVHSRASGVVQCLIVENGEVVRSFAPQKNLILNQGLNLVCSTYSWQALFAYCVAGTGVTGTSFSSGSGQTGSGSATTFTGPGAVNFSTSAAIGDMIKMTSGASSGVEVRITTVTDATHVEYTPSATISAGEFNVYRTSQVGLVTEVKRSNTYLTGAGNCGSSVSGTSAVLKRTFDFTAESGSVTYNEIGFSYAAAVANNLFSRIKLASGVSLVAGQQLRVVYTLTIALSPTTLTPITFAITGWPVSPSTSLDGDLQLVYPGITGVDTSGNNAGIDVAGRYAAGALEPSWALYGPGGIYCAIFLSTVSTAPSTFNTAQASRVTNLVYKDITLATYTALNFYRDKSATFLVGDANRTDWRCMGLSGRTTATDAGSAGQCIICIFDEAQTKTSLYTLTLTFRLSVGRVLA